MNLTKKQIEAIIARTKTELKGTYENMCEVLGYFQKSNTNWRYVAGWTYQGDLVVTVFGEIQ